MRVSNNEKLYIVDYEMRCSFIKMLLIAEN